VSEYRCSWHQHVCQVISSVGKVAERRYVTGKQDFIPTANVKL